MPVCLVWRSFGSKARDTFEMKKYIEILSEIEIGGEEALEAESKASIRGQNRQGLGEPPFFTWCECPALEPWSHR